MCRLIFPLAVLYDVSGEKKHLDMLYRVTKDLEAHRHPFGGYCEWDTGYKAACSRESRGECSLLTVNDISVRLQYLAKQSLLAFRARRFLSYNVDLSASGVV